MAHRERSPVHVPLRTSSRNRLRPSDMERREEDGSLLGRRVSKAQRILGTDLPIPNNRGGWDQTQTQIQPQPQTQKKKQKPRSLRANLRTPPEGSSYRQQHSGFVAFPSNAGDNVPPPNLRVRASSPLLGYDYRSQDNAPPIPKPSRKIHQSGSSSTLFSYFSSKEPTAKSTHTPPKHSLQPRVRNELGVDPQVTFQQQESRSASKESKRKVRPPRIDLSILFPKPREPAPPLLSPQRMTHSPSPVSTVVSDYPSKLDRVESRSNSRKLGEPLPPRASVVPNDIQKHNDRSDLLSIPESRNTEWFDQPLERTVGTSEIDVALDRYARRRSLFSRSSVSTASREQLQTDQRRPLDALETRRGHSPASSRRKEAYLSPKSQQNAARHQISNPEEPWRGETGNLRSVKSSVSKKSSKSTLKNKDLQNSSVLCLSSSEDEDEEQEPPAEQRANNKHLRDSVATYGDFEPEIYTASTAQAATGRVLQRVERAPSTSSRGSHQAPLAHSAPRRTSYASISSTGKSSYMTRRTTQSRRSSNIPIIAEPDILEQFPQQPLRTPQELKEMNRRSRVIAVTRQEQDLLEAMRQRKGKVTPSLFNYNSAVEADRASVLSGPSRDSFCGSDTSFLRLSAVFPPLHARTDQGAIHTDKDSSPSQSSSSDTEQKTGNSIVWPRFSMGYSESLPSPSTSNASPLTPTLPIHRFSPLPSPKPPPRGPPPAIPADQKQHTRRRTDSSEAILLNESGDPQPKHDLPLWSFDFDWNHDRASLAAVH
ncbi:uncharacterized protein N7459_010025 [Penicillium hispanicum]|uniref:uncharacterized protein n=1 Tax=Penicillium hispanicum TaxID=1080232 RepID=UPI002541EC7D|nr:uncharacterized protein N7459_010025 [Penicillium hispanicum]KAJ5570595.1 hypothetical protein N7459_010025 [Penicillium hispanicum]